MLILAFETSCDDTACALVRDGRQVLASHTVGQAAIHAQYGGVIPELAARAHQQAIDTTLQACLEQANVTLAEVDAFAATVGPGLIGSLLVGVMAAKTLAWQTGKPFIGVHHLRGHVASAYLHTTNTPPNTLAPPFVCLLASGGHTQLLHVTSHTHWQVLGQTLDDAAGEAYDKVARLLGLPFPGGPALDALAQTYPPDAPLFALPVAKTKQPLDFSFSGLKTATLRLIEQQLPSNLAMAELSPEQQLVRAKLAASFQAAVVNAMVSRLKHVAATVPEAHWVVVGGVSANSAIRHALQQLANQHTIALTCAPLAYCSDNASMIAASAFFSPLSHGLNAEVFSRDGVALAQ
jgi:N6-L-threonylcarbamoyladenine synthase